MKFTHAYLDLKVSHTINLVLVDQGKAFSRVSYSMTIKGLNDMKVALSLMRILISYSSVRPITRRYKGVFSNQRSLPGSSLPGAFLIHNE